jgi:uncharacterized protein
VLFYSPAVIAAFCLVTIGVILFLYARFVEPNQLAVRRLRVDSKGAVDPGVPLRIALLSDFHYPRSMSAAAVRRAIETANRLEPDIVFVLGDIFDKRSHEPAVLPQDIREVFAGIKSRHGVFGVLGNHDHWFDAPAIRKAIAAETNIRLIDNESIRLEIDGKSLYIVGVGDLGSKDMDFAKAVRDVPTDAPIVLLSHNPDVVEEIRDERIIVQFSGHTHGGQVRLPGIGAPYVPSRFGSKYALGWCTQGNHPLYVTTGVCSTEQLRFLCPPEVTWVELY